MSLILAIDQSTSATKAVLFDARGKVLDKASRNHRQIYPQPGWVEHDAEEIWQNVLAVIGEIARRNRAKLAQARRAEHHQPARDRAGVRSQDRQAAAPRAGLAGSSRRRHLRQAHQARPRPERAAQDRAEDRHLLLRLKAPLAGREQTRHRRQTQERRRRHRHD